MATAKKSRLKIAALGSATGSHDANRTSVFARMGHDVCMLSNRHADIPGVRLVAIRGNAVRSPALRRFAVMADTLRAILSERADIWHAHYAADYGTWAVALLARRPLVITVMGGDVLFEEQGTQGLIGRALTRFSLRRADRVLVKSNALGDVVASFGVPRERIVRVIWGIDLDRFKVDAGEVAQLRAQWGAQDRLVLLAPRMLQPFYNHHLLIEALPGIVAQGHDVIVVFALKGAEEPYKASIVEQAQRLGVAERLRFSLPRAPETMASLYASADLVISLAPSDGMPQTPIEAGAVERATLMTDLERYRELFTDGENIAFTPLEANEIARRASDLLGNPALCRAIASGAGRLMREYAELQREAERVETIYYDLVAARGGSSAAATSGGTR